MWKKFKSLKLGLKIIVGIMAIIFLPVTLLLLSIELLIKNIKSKKKISSVISIFLVLFMLLINYSFVEGIKLSQDPEYIAQLEAKEQAKEEKIEAEKQKTLAKQEQEQKIKSEQEAKKKAAQEQKVKLEQEVKAKEEATKANAEQEKNQKENITKQKTSNVKYDALQQLYLDIDNNLSYEEILKKVKKSKLPYTDQEYSSGQTIKVAYTSEVAKQRYADEGDNVQISFNLNKKTNKLNFSTLEYFNHKKFITIFDYESGTYWDFRDGKDKGLYINNYSNVTGNKEEKYIKSNSKENQLKYIFEYKK
ncbi:membrane protein [Intestinibacter bartlettii]|uniref:Putative membrane protein n=1 Tax=Intestinibacter bartlettii CAG:1329 TaxID=1263063 RepID=R5XQZ9_9FIRM|nr:membrane protein [Intestinibacter bartlettii]CDA11231.1 putative membrane protein [Intestinibacter bartlettii CAG:1329]